MVLYYDAKEQHTLSDDLVSALKEAEIPMASLVHFGWMFHGTEMTGEHKERFFKRSPGIVQRSYLRTRKGGGKCGKCGQFFEFRQCPTTFRFVATKSIRIFQKIVAAHGEPQKPNETDNIRGRKW